MIFGIGEAASYDKEHFYRNGKNQGLQVVILHTYHPILLLLASSQTTLRNGTTRTDEASITLIRKGK